MLTTPDPKTIMLLLAMIGVMGGLVSLLSRLIDKVWPGKSNGRCNWDVDDRDHVWKHMEQVHSKLDKCRSKLTDATDHLGETVKSMKLHDLNAQVWMKGMDMSGSAQLQELTAIRRIHEKALVTNSKVLTALEILIALYKQNGRKS